VGNGGVQFRAVKLFEFSISPKFKRADRRGCGVFLYHVKRGGALKIAVQLIGNLAPRTAFGYVQRKFAIPDFQVAFRLLDVDFRRPVIAAHQQPANRDLEKFF